MARGCPRGKRTTSFLVVSLGFTLAAQAGVVLNEIHFNPPEGGQVEFVELFNSDGAPVPIGGWSFTSGIRFVFPEEAVLAPGGYAVVCQNREEVARRFGLPPESLHGDFAGSLDNGGEPLALSDARGSVVDEVRYDDVPPWDADADGTGPSLERTCASFDSTHPRNWNAAEGRDPTPLAPNHLSACPPPSIPPPDIAITEIYYHPLDDKDALDEFVELRNNTGAPVNLKGYSFSAGIDFRFAEDTLLAAGGHLIVCRDPERFATAHGIAGARGPFTGQLSNDGERLTLLDPLGSFVDSVRYGDDGDWPVAPDGLGYSLEKIVPTAPSDDPASWAEAQPRELTGWTRVVVSGVATANRLLIYLDGAGEFFIDNVSLIDPAVPDVNHIPNGSFDADLAGWALNGNHADTTWDATGGPDGSGALHLIANGRGTGVTQGLYIDAVPELVRTQGPSYKLSLDIRYVTGSKGLIVRLSGATSARGIFWQFGRGVLWSPGAANSAAAERLPPFVTAVTRYPREPGATDPVAITARVRSADGIRLVKFAYHVDGGPEPQEVEILDDGLHGDGLAGDGVFGGGIPAHPHNTIITFRIEAEDAFSTRTLSPPDSDPTGFHGYYVNDLRPASKLPTFTLLINHKAATPARTLISALDCATYRSASVAYQGDLYYNVGLRERGQSVCNSTKPFLKVRFQRGREFEGLRKLNFQSLWTDKALVREVLAWEAFGHVGMPTCHEEHVRLHANGKYFGLYARLEHPDQQFLERNRLNPEGNLYKATASREEVTGTYEKKTNENGDFTDLRQFLTALNSTPAANLRTFFAQTVDEDRVIDYQLGQTLTNNSDYPHKNHYLYHDTASGRWMPLTWDMDLTYGKLWDGTYGGVLHDKMHNPGNTPWYTTNVDGAGGGNVLLDRFFSLAGDYYRRAYLTRLWDALHEKYTQEFFERRISALRELIYEEQSEDLAAWNRSPPTADDPRAPRDFDPNLDRVREHVRVRRAFLLNYLQTRSRFTGHDRLKITEVLYNPAGAGEELEWLEIWNATGKDIDVSRWSIEGLGYVFPEGTSFAKDEVAVVAKDPAAFQAWHGPGSRVLGPYPDSLDNDGEILRVKDAGPGHPATVDFLRYGAEGDWPRAADGLGYSIELKNVSPDRDNDLGIYWRASQRVGGTPGKLPGISAGYSFFRRGDVNADHTYNITDALTILRHLFLGLTEPPCLAAADVDGNGTVATADALFLLRYLFAGAPATLPSPGPRECLPVGEVACQVTNCEE